MTPNGQNGTRPNDKRQEAPDQHPFIAALLEKPELLIADLHEEIELLIDALIAARLNPEVEDGATPRDIALDLYDEELISKQDAKVKGGLEDAEFFDALIARRQTRPRS